MFIHRRQDKKFLHQGCNSNRVWDNQDNHKDITVDRINHLLNILMAIIHPVVNLDNNSNTLKEQCQISLNQCRLDHLGPTPLKEGHQDNSLNKTQQHRISNNLNLLALKDPGEPHPLSLDNTHSPNSNNNIMVMVVIQIILNMRIQTNQTLTARCQILTNLLQLHLLQLVMQFHPNSSNIPLVLAQGILKIHKIILELHQRIKLDIHKIHKTITIIRELMEQTRQVQTLRRIIEEEQELLLVVAHLDTLQTMVVSSSILHKGILKARGIIILELLQSHNKAQGHNNHLQHNNLARRINLINSNIR